MGSAVPSPERRPFVSFAVAVGAAFAVSLVLAFVGSLIGSALAGVLVLAVGLRMAWVLHRPAEQDESRRRFIAGASAAGVGLVAGGSALGRTIFRATRPAAGPDLHEMATAI